MPKVKAIFYDLPDGSYPAQEFIDSLDIKMQAKMLRTIVFYRKTVPTFVSLILSISRMAYWNCAQKSDPISHGSCISSTTVRKPS